MYLTRKSTNRFIPLVTLLGSVRSLVHRRSLLAPPLVAAAAAAMTTDAASATSPPPSPPSSSPPPPLLLWNRETSPRNDYDADAPIVKTCKILALSDPDDVNNVSLKKSLPDGCEMLHVGIDDFDVNALNEAGCNTVFCSHPNAKEPLAQVLREIPSIEWVHTRSAGLDAYFSPTVAAWHGTITNAKGMFSSTLGEYTLAACSYFAKNFARLKANQAKAEWDRYPILEMRGATLGIIGYGDIGRAAARLAKAYGMKVIALRRHPTPEPLICDEMVESSRLNYVFEQSDYVMCAAPLTEATRNMIGSEQFKVAKKGCVFINVGRGPVVDEEAMIAALKNGQLKGAGLDVVATEPLPKSSPLWSMDNVLLSPHNMDLTVTFMKESSDFFVAEQLPRFVRGIPLYNKVNNAAGY